MDETRQMPLRLAPWRLTAIGAIVLAGLFGAYLLHISLAAGFAVGLCALVVAAARQGVPLSALGRYMGRGIGHTREVIWILLLVGLLIPAWMASGTIPYLIDVGLGLMHPAYFVTGSFMLAALVSLLLGTSTGTLSSIGIPLMGMAAFLHVPLPLAAGAIVSGAFVGDRTSPFSSAYRLVASSTGLTVRELGKALLPTTAGAIAACLLFYGASDWLGHWSQGERSVPSTGFSVYFRYHAVLALPPIVLIGCILLRWKTRSAFLLSVALSIALGTWLQGIGTAAWLRFLWQGFASESLPTLHGKGVSGMVDLVMLIALAGAFNGILEETGLIRPYAERIVGHSPSLMRATWGASLFGLGLGLVACTQTLPIMMTGRNLLDTWVKRFDRRSLGRVTADAGLIFAALVPWNMLAILCSTIIGIPVAHYAVYAVFLWALPPLTLLTSVTNKRKRGSGWHFPYQIKNG